MNDYFSNSGPYFDSVGTNVNIQFCLATVDPMGNSTNGITRDVSVYTDIRFGGGLSNTDDSMKNVNRWNPYRYMNVWIVRSVSGWSNAYATFPASLGKGDDGIVITASGLGGIHYLIAHEAGHYLGLYHTDEGNSCINFNCLLDGDQVCDTPPMLSHFNPCPYNSCSTELNDTTGFNPFSTDQMDVSTIMKPLQGCGLIFTSGQGDRMTAALTQIRYALLTSNACGANPGGPVPVAGFTYSVQCDTVQFISTSTNAEFIEWDFNNDGITDALGDTVKIKFENNGNHTVRTLAYCQGGGDVFTQTISVNAHLTSIYPLQSTFGVQANGKVCHDASVVLTAVPGMSSYLWNTGATTQSISFLADSSFSISLTCTDSSGFTWEFCPDPLRYFEVLPPLPRPSIYRLSPDSICFRDSLHLGVQLPADQFVYQWMINNGAIWSSDTLLNIQANLTTSINISVNSIDYTGCKTSSDTLEFYIDPSPTLPYVPVVSGNTLFGYGNGWNNQFYQDGQIIPGAAQSSYTVTQPGCYRVATWLLLPQCQILSDTICFQITGIESTGRNRQLPAYPNPCNTYTNIQLPSNSNFVDKEIFGLRNTLGTRLELPVKLLSSELIQLDLSKLPDGNYIFSAGNYKYRIIKMAE